MIYFCPYAGAPTSRRGDSDGAMATLAESARTVGVTAGATAACAAGPTCGDGGVCGCDSSPAESSVSMGLPKALQPPALQLTPEPLDDTEQLESVW